MSNQNIVEISNITIKGSAAWLNFSADKWVINLKSLNFGKNHQNLENIKICLIDTEFECNIFDKLKTEWSVDTFNMLLPECPHNEMFNMIEGVASATNRPCILSSDNDVEFDGVGFGSYSWCKTKTSQYSIKLTELSIVDKTTIYSIKDCLLIAKFLKV